MKIFKILLITCLFSFCSFAQYTPPLNITPLQWSGSFGELRKDHFHGGIDYRTEQREGLAVFAIDSGIIFKLEISPKGYGKVLYIRHPYGLISLYAHLSAFTPTLDSILQSYGLQNDSIVSLDLNIPIIQGEQIALSGNSGSSGGPHLHFELRDASNSIQINPCLLGFTTEDTTPPSMKKLKIYNLDKNKSRTYHLVFQNQQYQLKRKQKVKCREGNYAFGLQAVDLIENLPFSYGLYSLQFQIDSQVIYSYSLNNIALSSSHLIVDHIDQATYLKNNDRFERTQSNYKDSLSIVNIVENNGVYPLKRGKKYELKILAKDFNGNTAEFKCTLIVRKKYILF